MKEEERFKTVGDKDHRCMRDLKEAEYIHYIQSYNPVLGSLVYLLKNEV